MSIRGNSSLNIKFTQIVLDASYAVYPACVISQSLISPSNAISSDMYFGKEDRRSSRGENWGLQAELVGDALRESVSKVAGRLSTLSTGIVSSIQDKYSSWSSPRLRGRKWKIAALTRPVWSVGEVIEER